jgi:phosphoribosylglycinamide formyltransferase-1
LSAARLPVVVLLSGSGRTLENFLARIAADALPLEIVAVASRRRDYADADAHNAALNVWLAPFAPRMILLAGYLCFYARPDWLDGPVLNIHPALLPKFGGQGMWGRHVHEAVLAAGETQSGCTVHHVSPVYDEGAVVAQARVPVLPDDDADALAARVFAAECELYPAVAARLARELLGDRCG